MGKHKSVKQRPTRTSSASLSAARIWELDLLRGVCVLLMVADHALFDLGFFFGPQWYGPEQSGFFPALSRFVQDNWSHPLHTGARMIVVGSFVGLCGTCCSFSRSNWRRGGKLLLVALALTGVTAALDAVAGIRDYYIIRCGVLHMLSASILLYAALQRAGRPLLLLFGALLTLAPYLLPPGPGLPLFVLGLNHDFYSADYFPLLPWCGLFLLGAALGGRLYAQRRSLLTPPRQLERWRLVMFAGRHALWFYLLHQPLIYGAFWLAGQLR